MSEPGLPSGWAWATLDDITVPKIDQREPGERGVAYIDISSIDRGAKRIGETKTVTRRTAPTRARQWVRAGDVLVSMTRPNLNAVALVPSAHDGSVASTGFDVLRATEVLPEWIFNRVRTRDFVADVCKGLQGVVYPAIRPHDVRCHRLPIAPLPEQERVVAALDSYVTRLDAAAAGMRRVQHNLERYRASVLQAAVEGRLVPTEAELACARGRDYEPASELLKRTLAERKRRWEEAELEKLKANGTAPSDDRWKRRYKEPERPDAPALPDLPEGWCWASMDQLTSHLTSGSRDWSKYYGKGSCIFLMAQNVRPGRLDLSFVQRVDPPPDDPSRERSQVKAGDLLVTIVGANTGDVCLVPQELPEHYVCQSVALMRPVDTEMSPFLDHYFNSPIGQGVYERFMYGQGRPHLGFVHLRNTEVPIPPIAEQRRITSQVAELLSDGGAVGVWVASCMTRVDQLRQAVLRLAFAGKLVDQDPREEPASALLERIRKKHAVKAGEAKTRPRSWSRRTRA